VRCERARPLRVDAAQSLNTTARDPLPIGASTHRNAKIVAGSKCRVVTSAVSAPVRADSFKPWVSPPVATGVASLDLFD